MQNLSDLFSAEELPAFIEAVKSGNEETVNSLYQSAHQRMESAHITPLKSELEKLKAEMVEAEKKLHGRFISEKVRRPLAKKLGVKESDFENLKEDEIFEKAFELHKGKLSVTEAEALAKLQEVTNENLTLAEKLQLAEQEKVQIKESIYREVHERNVKTSFFASSVGVLRDEAELSDVVDIVTNEFEKQGIVFAVENGEVVARKKDGGAIFGTANKILSAKEVLSLSKKLPMFQKTLQAAIPQVVPNIPQATEMPKFATFEEYERYLNSNK